MVFYEVLKLKRQSKLYEKIELGNYRSIRAGTLT
jgi:hypothetical protein